MKDKSNSKQLEAIDMFNKTVEQFDKDIERLYKPSKEELAKSIIQMIKEFEEGRVILSSPLKELKNDDFGV